MAEGAGCEWQRQWRGIVNLRTFDDISVKTCASTVS
jgi:hypothetical protein